MDSQLLTLSKIFTERLFRIPDFQRGYAWTEKQLKDFWTDLCQLEQGKNHYTGVLTLEAVPPSTIDTWSDDRWIVASRKYEAYYIVDGQQRLTTSIIAIQVILESVGKDAQLNFTSVEDIRRKFIYDSKDNFISRSYIFGYEKDNPSYEFLKTRIFCEYSSEGVTQETVYTQNLEFAKTYFLERVREQTHEELEVLYTKLTQQLLFNIFTISEDVDVCVAFETMNNRGKALSYLELLKNRLVYLSLKFDADEFEKSKLRKSINDCWKAIYHNLGRNKGLPLDDDKFLINHYIIYFGSDLLDEEIPEELRYRRLMRADYSSHLLETKFIASNVTDRAKDGERISLSDVYKYVSSLQQYIECWYKIYNPDESEFDVEVKLWLDRLNRMGMDPFLPLVMVLIKHCTRTAELSQVLKAIERNIWFFVDLREKNRHR